jgi:hypothetical protein
MRYWQAFCRSDEVSRCSKGCRNGTYLVCRLLVSDEGSLVWSGLVFDESCGCCM